MEQDRAAKPAKISFCIYGPAPKKALSKRLTVAIKNINKNLHNQGEAVASFRKSTHSLDHEMKSLQRTVRKYQRAVATINVVPLRKKSLRLANIMGPDD